jgi:glycosyltransferase involved in cell wall biosynthesis
VLYSREPLRGDLAKLPENWSVKVLGWPPKRFWTQIRLSLEMLFHKPDVLFIPAHVFPIIHPKKTVMTIHDVVALKFPQSYNWFERWYSVWSAKYALKKLWKIIVPSESVKQDLVDNFRFKILDFRINVIKHGYDERYSVFAEASADKEEILKKFNIKKPYLLSIGRLEEKKNTVRIIHAFNNLKSTCLPAGREILNLQLVLIGGPGHGYEKVLEAIKNSPYKNDIITPGWVSDEDLPIIMKNAEIFVFPSLAEGFGIPVLEAMVSGVPVVTSLGGATQEVGSEACEYVDPMNVEEIAGAISKLLENSELKEKSIQAGLKRVKEFGWEKSAKETLDCLIS